MITDFRYNLSPLNLTQIVNCGPEGLGAPLFKSQDTKNSLSEAHFNVKHFKISVRHDCYSMKIQNPGFLEGQNIAKATIFLNVFQKKY